MPAEAESVELVGAGLTVEQAAAGAVPLQSTKDTECFLTIVSISSARWRWLVWLVWHRGHVSVT